MQSYRIAAIPGDGIGKEVVPEGMRVLDAAGRRFGIAFAWDQFDWSCEHYAKHGRMMPDGRPRHRSAATTRSSSARSASPACPTTSRSGAC